MMTIQNTDDLFDAAKKMKVATGKEAEAKLKQYQKRTILRNEALLQMFMNKVSRAIGFHYGIDWYLPSAWVLQGNGSATTQAIS